MLFNIRRNNVRVSREIKWNLVNKMRWRKLFTVHKRPGQMIQAETLMMKSHTVLDFLWLLKENSRKTVLYGERFSFLIFGWGSLSHRHLLSSWTVSLLHLKWMERERHSAVEVPFDISRVKRAADTSFTFSFNADAMTSDNSLRLI